MSHMHHEERRGVSPVVAVLLLVAVSVALSATVGVFVLDLGKEVDGEASHAGVKVTENADGSATVTLMTDANGGAVRVSYDDGGATLADPGDTATIPAGATNASVIREGNGGGTVIQTVTVDSGQSVSEPDTPLVWASSSEWDAAVSQSRVVHESVQNTDHEDASLVKLGYTASSPPDALKAYWRLDEDGGSTTYDSGSVSHGATPTNGTLQDEAGLLGTNAYRFDGSDDVVRGPDDFDIGQSNLTVSTWVKTTQSSGTGEFVGLGYKDSDGNKHFVELRSKNGVLQSILWDQTISGSDRLSLRSDDRIDDGEWHHVAITFDNDADSGHLYLDGQVVNSTSIDEGFTYNPSESTTPDPAWLGIGALRKYPNAYPSVYNHYEGKLDEIRIYDKSLTTADVQALYETTQTGALTTTSQSFEAPAKPDLQNLTYSLNGQTTTVTVVGSPGTAAEEEQSVSLDGSTGYDLTWEDTHTDFRVRIEFETSDPETTPTLGHLELK